MAPGDEFELTYEITNEGDEPTSALGLNVTAVPNGLDVESVRTAEGSTAEDRNAVFWVSPVDHGESVTATFVVAVDDDATGEYAVDSEVASSTTSVHRSTTVTVEAGASGTGDGSTEGGDGAGGNAGGSDGSEAGSEADDGGSGGDDGAGQEFRDGGSSAGALGDIAEPSTVMAAGLLDAIVIAFGVYRRR